MKTFLMGVVASLVLGCGCTQDLESPESEEVVELTDDTQSEEEVEEAEPSPITWEDCGGALGEHACDFTFKDQTDTEWSLYDHYGEIIVLDFSVVWCGPCQSAATNVAAHMNEYADDGVVWVTVLLQDATGDSVSLDDVQSWASTYNIPLTSPVLQGDYSVVDLSAVDGYPVSSYPTIVVVDREMVIHAGVHGWSQPMVEGWVDELLEE